MTNYFNNDNDNNIDEIELNIPSFMQTREYEIERQKRIAAKQNNSSTKMTYINDNGIKRLPRKRKINKSANRIKIITAIGALVIIFNLGIKVVDKLTADPHEFVIPDGYTSIYTAETAEFGDSITSIAREYYDDVYVEAYGSIENYVDAIIAQNNLNRNGDIKVYDTINLPVLIDENNEYFIQIKNIEAEIEAIKNNEYWVPYTVKSGDSLSALAAKASGSSGETISLTNSIRSHNDLENGILRIGQEIKIINPELGKLKLQLAELKLLLQESLKVQSQNTK